MRYELLFLNRSHRVADRFAFSAPNDVEAQGAAEDLAEAAERELWCGRRIVGRWTARRGERSTDTD